MAAKRANPNVIKLHRSYSIAELAARLIVHKNTVRLWQRDGLQPLDRKRPILFQGAAVRAFLRHRNASRKRPCPPGTIYCFKCREPHRPALAMVDYRPITATSGNLAALCETCGTAMHRRVRQGSIAAAMPGIRVQLVEASPRLKGSPSPSLNCDLERQTKP